MPRACAQSRTEVVIAPDCARKAMPPCCGVRCAKLAFKPMPGTSTPSVFGPTIRTRCGRAASSIACCSDPQSGSNALNPAETTTTPRVPRAPSSATIRGTSRAGTASTARSGVSGMLAASA